MANKKRRCSQCKSYKVADGGIVINNAFFCDINCATKKAFNGIQKVKDDKHKVRKKEFNANDKSLRRKAAQKAFNAYIRFRDSNCSCISCGRSSGAKVNAGHYKSVGSTPSLRFCELNCHLQCEHCNMFKSGNIENYRINLIDKIGLGNVEWLEGPHEPKKYTCEELKEIELKYKNLIKKMTAQQLE